MLIVACNRRGGGGRKDIYNRLTMAKRKSFWMCFVVCEAVGSCVEGLSVEGGGNDSRLFRVMGYHSVCAGLGLSGSGNGVSLRCWGMLLNLREASREAEE